MASVKEFLAAHGLEAMSTTMAKVPGAPHWQQWATAMGWSNWPEFEIRTGTNGAPQRWKAPTAAKAIQGAKWAARRRGRSLTRAEQHDAFIRHLGKGDG